MNLFNVKKVKGEEFFVCLYKGDTYFSHVDREVVKHFKEEFQALIERCGDDFIGELRLIALEQMVESGVICGE